MKRYIIAGMFILAAIFPILFIPLLALTLVIIFVIIPYIMTHPVWGKNDVDLDPHHHSVQ